eukprot:350500-Chlamydomonas_euryale.AAC.19
MHAHAYGHEESRKCIRASPGKASIMLSPCLPLCNRCFGTILGEAFQGLIRIRSAVNLRRPAISHSRPFLRPRRKTLLDPSREGDRIGFVRARLDPAGHPHVTSRVVGTRSSPRRRPASSIDMRCRSAHHRALLKLSLLRPCASGNMCASGYMYMRPPGCQRRSSEMAMCSAKGSHRAVRTARLRKFLAGPLFIISLFLGLVRARSRAAGRRVASVATEDVLYVTVPGSSQLGGCQRSLATPGRKGDRLYGHTSSHRVGKPASRLVGACVDAS